MEVAWLLGSWGRWQCQVHRGESSYCHRRCGDIRNFSSLWQLCPSENWAWRWCSCLDRRDPGKAKRAGIPTASATGAMTLFEYFLTSGNWQSEGLFGWCLSVAWPIQAMHSKSSPDWGPSLLLGMSGTEMASLGGSFSTVPNNRDQPFLGLSLFFSCQWWCVGRGYSVGSSRCVWLSNIALPPWLPGFPP